MDAKEWRAAQRDLREKLRHLHVSDEGEPAAPASGPPPWVSVIVVCWNSRSVLGRCLDQLLAQDYPSYDVIVVDDGSEDDTLEVAQSAAAGHEQLKIVASGRNRGCPHARNLGVRHAKGEMVAFIDADGYAAPDWLSRIVQAFAADAGIGGVASTVFFAANPQVINGAGGTVNRQGWAADLSMNEPYERAQIASEALYPMGCGMAVRRAALERVGLFDDRMLNYYDDVDYGIRLWRAGYRVVVAPEAWIDHGFGGAGSGDQARKQLLCEQHRMRVVLKHAPLRLLPRWAAHEVSALWSCPWSRRELKFRAIGWNARHFISTLRSRRRLRDSPHAPARLFDPSWGEGFPAGMPELVRPQPANAKGQIDMADPAIDELLPYGWFPREELHGATYRWAAVQASALIRLEEPARMLRLEYAHAPVDLGGIDIGLRRLGDAAALAPVWATRLMWQHSERGVENHPLCLSPGDYEVLFSCPGGAWTDPPRESRKLAFALARMSFEHSYVLPAGGADMSAPSVEQQLVHGWFGHEAGDRAYRWSSKCAALLIRVPEDACSMQLVYRLPPGSIGGVIVAATQLHHRRASWTERIDWLDGGWRVENFPLQLAAGDYLLSFDADATWSNVGGANPAFGSEHRSLGIAVSSVTVVAGGGRAAGSPAARDPLDGHAISQGNLDD